MPKKPTLPFGYINFSKNGRVSKHVEKMPDDKRGQEKEVTSRFIEAVNNANHETSG